MGGEEEWSGDVLQHTQLHIQVAIFTETAGDHVQMHYMLITLVELSAHYRTAFFALY